MQEIYCVLHGKVQGVGFRMFVLREATRLQIVGYVRNNADGTLTIIGQGLQQTLEDFITTIQHGPLFARVDDIVTTWKIPVEHYSNFAIL